jgi:hypothetical protein
MEKYNYNFERTKCLAAITTFDMGETYLRGALALQGKVFFFFLNEEEQRF